MPPSPRVWMILGCTPTNIGFLFTKSILDRGDRVIVTAPNPSTLSDFRSLGAETLRLDTNSSQPAINATVFQATTIYGRIDVLLCSHSNIQLGTIEDVSNEEFTRQIEINVFGPFKVVRALLPHFRNRRSGTFAFIGSLHGWVGYGGCGAFAGSMFALEGMVESLHAETRHLGLGVLLVEAGSFRRHSSASDEMVIKQSAIPEYSGLMDQLCRYVDDQDGVQCADPEKLVELVVALVGREARFEDRGMPLRLPLGLESVSLVRSKCEATLGLLKDWGLVVAGDEPQRR